jgi:hypothetical protein
MSKALRAGKGRFNANNSTTGSSFPLTRTTKLPLPGFSSLILTDAFPLTEKMVHDDEIDNSAKEREY